jgi:polyferredoxin
MALLIIIVFVGVAIYQISRLKRAGQRREIVFFTVFWLSGFILLMMLSAGVKFPSVVGTIIGILDAIGLHY